MAAQLRTPRCLQTAQMPPWYGPQCMPHACAGPAAADVQAAHVSTESTQPESTPRHREHITAQRLMLQGSWTAQCVTNCLQLLLCVSVAHCTHPSIWPAASLAPFRPKPLLTSTGPEPWERFCGQIQRLMPEASQPGRCYCVTTNLLRLLLLLCLSVARDTHIQHVAYCPAQT